MQFMVRVELRSPTLEKYTHLHRALAAERIHSSLTAEDTKKRYRMPNGTFWANFSASPWEVLDAAKRAAFPIDPRARIVVSGGSKVVFVNCPIEEEPSLKASFASLIGLGSDALPRHPRLAPVPSYSGIGRTNPVVTRNGSSWLRRLVPFKN